MVKSLYPHSLRMEVDIIDGPAICVLDVCYKSHVFSTSRVVSSIQKDD